MGHIVGKNVYRALGKKIDGLPTRAPWNETLYQILKELYTEEEALLVCKMPYSLATFSRIQKSTNMASEKLERTLMALCEKGLVIDLFLKDKKYFMPSPMVIGIFEFSMMRTKADVDLKKCAHLFHDYLLGNEDFFRANLGSNQRVALARALPYDNSFSEEIISEVLDYEKAKKVVEQESRFSVGICSCRHEKLHLNEKKCSVPLNSCTSFGKAAEYLIRNKLAKEVSKTEMLELVDRSRENKLVLSADNVKNQVGYICHCCECCCNMLQGITRFGYTNTVMTSSFIAAVDQANCKGCGKCVKACPVKALQLKKNKEENTAHVVIDSSFCLGCGVCVHSCPSKTISLIFRKQKPLHPETTFERVILQCLEQGTLQNQLFDDMNKVSHQFMRGVVGGFLRLSPVKKALMSDMLRSHFLQAIKKGAKVQKRNHVTEI